MSKPVHHINLSDVHFVMEQAKEIYNRMPGHGQLPGMNRALTQGERLALAYLWASFYVVGRHGVDTTGFVVTVSRPDSEAIE